MAQVVRRQGPLELAITCRLAGFRSQVSARILRPEGRFLAVLRNRLNLQRFGDGESPSKSE